MHDAPKKLLRLVQTLDVVAEAAGAIRDAHLARVYVRASFIALHNLLTYAPFVKNRSALPAAELRRVEALLQRLREDHGGFEAIRHKTGAHHQGLPLPTLYEQWTSVTNATVSILRDDVLAIYAILASSSATDTFARPIDTPDAFRRAFAELPTRGGAVTFGADRFAGARPNTIMSIPTHPVHEKAQRVVTILDNIRCLAVLGPATSRHAIANIALWQLLVCDAVSLFRCMFQDEPGDPGRNIEADDSLLTRWRGEKLGGVTILENFERDAILESRLVEARNKAGAHLDATSSLQTLDNYFASFTVGEVAKYLGELEVCFKRACAADPIMGRHLMGDLVLSAVAAGPGASKPYD